MKIVNMAHLGVEGKQSRETVSEETQMLDTPDKNDESATTNMFRELIKNHV